MKLSKINQTLIIMSTVAIVFDLLRLDVWGSSELFYLVWNLFLAWVPYIISLLFIKKDMPGRRFLPVFIIWLLFFPNAPYLVTDVLHIASKTSGFLWYDSLLFFFFGWIGLLLGMLSLSHVHQFFRGRYGQKVSEIIIFLICFISSFGIYLGRFERWNSWDIFVNPFELMRHSINLSLIHPTIPLYFVGVFTIFMYLVYRTMDVLMGESKT